MPRDPNAEVVNQLHARLDEMRAKVLEARKINDHLREDAENKIQNIKKIESDIKEENELFQKKREDVLRKRKDKRDDHLLR